MILLKSWRVYLPCFVVLLILLCITFSITGSSSFSYCIENGGYGYYNQLAKDVKNVPPPRIRLRGLRLVERCTGVYASKYNSEITAFSTLLLSFITGGLMWLGYEQRKTTIRQLRAYIFPTTVDLMDGSTVFPPKPEFSRVPRVSMTFKNTGQTPAFNLAIYANIVVIEPINELALKIPKLKEKGAALGAGASMVKIQQLDRHLTQSEVDDIIAGVKRVYFHGRIEYDCMGEKCFTNFRFFHSGSYPAPMGTILMHSDDGNEAN